MAEDREAGNRGKRQAGPWRPTSREAGEAVRLICGEDRTAEWNRRAWVQEGDRLGAGQAGGRAEHGPPLLDTRDGQHSLGCPVQRMALPGVVSGRFGGGGRWCVTELEADIFCNLGPPHTHTHSHTQGNCRLGVIININCSEGEGSRSAVTL